MLRPRTTIVGSDGDYQQAIVQPGYAVSLGVDAIDLWQQRFLLRKGVQVNDQSFGRGVQATGSIEELPPQSADVTAFIVSVQAGGEVGHRVVDQGHQPADHLQGATLEAGAHAVRTLFVVAARDGIHEFVVFANAITLFVMLPAPIRRQNIMRFARARGVQRMPAIFLGTGHHLPADNGANRLLGGFTLEDGFRLGQANLLSWSTDAGAGLFMRYKQATGQFLPLLQPMGIAAGA